MIIYTTLYKAKYLGTLKTILNVIKLFFSVCIHCLLHAFLLHFFGAIQGAGLLFGPPFLVRIRSCMCKYIFKEIVLEY